VIRRKRNIIEMAVATAIFGACAAGAMPAAQAAQAASDSGSQATQATTDQDQTKSKKQVANENQLQEVVINGFVSSLQNSIAIQKNSDSIVEAVSAQQIGQLPGTSIADALGRLPGLATQMVNGRPQQLSIHGLSADFITTLVDGNIQPSTANNRLVQLDQYPASWFNTIQVYLTPSADLINPGLAGTVDMQTMRPLSESHPVVNLNANYQTIEPHEVMPGPGVSTNGHDVNGIIADQFFDHTLGVLFGVDLESNPATIHHQGPWGYPTDANGNLVIGGSKNYNMSDLLNRNGYLATFEFRPSSAFTSTLDLTYEDSKETQQAKGAEFPLQWGCALTNCPGGFTFVPGTVSNGFDQTGTFDNVYPVIRNDYNHYDAKVYNVLWHNDLKLSDSWTANLDGGYSRAAREDEFLEAYSGYGYDGPSQTAFPGTNVAFRESGNGELLLYPSQGLDGSNVVLTDPQGWGSGANLVQAGFINSPHTEDYIGHLKLGATHFFESGPFSSIEFGADHQHRRKNYLINQDFLVLGGGSCGLVITKTCTPTETASIPASALEPTTDALAWMGVGPQVMYNPFALIASGVLVPYPTALSSISVPPEWVMNENDTTGYLQLNIQTDLGPNVGLRGNVGLQVSHTNQSSDGQRVAPGSTAGGSATTVLLPTRGGTSYTRYLPSLNLVLSMPDDNDVRLSVARTMARPRTDQMSASLGISTNNSNLLNTNPNQSYFSGTGGNPALLPTMSTNINASVEHYFRAGTGGYQCTGNEDRSSALCATGGEGYVQLSGYYLKLTDYINPTAATLFNFAPYVSGYLTPAQQAQLGTTYGIMTIPQNNGAGKIYGGQLATNLPLGGFTHWLNGVGVLASVTRTNSAVFYPGNPQPVTVTGLSKWVENYTLYYELDGFQASVSDSIRSSFLGRVFGISATRVEQYQEGTADVSAQVSYDFTSGMLKGLTLIATGSNLTNQGLRTYQNKDPRQVQTWEEYNRLYTIGFSYNFR
jgi:iron complex outermembrane receptor protein